MEGQDCQDDWFHQGRGNGQAAGSTFIVPNLRKYVQDILERALQETETSNYELEFCTKANQIRYALVNAKSWWILTMTKTYK